MYDLDFDGVRIESFTGEDSIHQQRFKIFNRDSLHELVTSKLIEQLREEGLLLPEDPKVNYGVLAGNIKVGHESKLISFFQEKGWLLVTPSALARGLRRFASRGYENDIVTMVIKISGAQQRRMNQLGIVASNAIRQRSPKFSSCHDSKPAANL